MNAINYLQNSFSKNLGTPTPQPEPQVDYRKRALAQNKQATLNQLSQGPQGEMQ